jgi:hypothetical protein
MVSRRRSKQRRRTVHLREEHSGRDRRWLDAYIDGEGSLVISGHDLGPATAVMSDEREYEWSHTFPPSSLPLLLSALGGTEGDDLLDLLAGRYTGQNSYGLEAVIRDTRATVPRRFWSWRP